MPNWPAPRHGGQGAYKETYAVDRFRCHTSPDFAPPHGRLAGRHRPGPGQPGCPGRHLAQQAHPLCGALWPGRRQRPGGACRGRGHCAPTGPGHHHRKPPRRGLVLGAEIVAKTAPGGFTFLAPAAGVVTNAMIKSKMPYKEDDLVPVAMMAVSPSVIVVPADSPIKDLKGLLAASKTGPGLNFSTAGTGSTPHFVAEMLKKSGAKLQVVPYKSGSEGVVAVVGKQVDATSEASVVVLPQIKGGKLRAVASTWNRRIAAMPDIATAEEQGFPNIFIGHWSGVFAPKGTPDEILDRMNRAIDAAIKSPELRARLIPQGIDPVGGTRADFVKFINAEKARLAPIAKASNMRED